MAKASRQKRRTYQTPKKARVGGANLFWYVATAIIVIGGIVGVALSRDTASGVGPHLGDHWHAALGVNDCGTWTPNWLTPFSQTGPVQAGTNTYAGMHSHGDGIMHMEPSTSGDEGDHATVGTYFKLAGFHLNTTSIKFGTLDPTTTVEEKNGNKCNGKPGVLRWSVNGKEKKGNPASYKLFNGDVVELVFTTADAKLPKQTEVPSYAKLQELVGNPNAPEPAPGVTVPAATPTTATPPGATSTTAAGSPTTTAAGTTSTTTP
jgi:hypothetical protein